MSSPPVQASRLLAYLPSIYSLPRSGDEGAFVGQFLQIFEKLLLGIGDGATLTITSDGLDPDDPGRAIVGLRMGIGQLLDANVIGNLFHPRLSFLFPGDQSTFIPTFADNVNEQALFDQLGYYVGIGEATDNAQSPTAPIEAWLSGFLDWLAAIAGVDIDKNLGVDQKRMLVAYLPILLRARGTALGMQWLLSAWLGLPLSPQSPPVDTNGEVRPWKVSVSNPAFSPIWVFDVDDETKPVFIVFDDAQTQPGSPIVSDLISVIPPSLTEQAYIPGLFQVDVLFACDGNDVCVLGDTATFQAIEDFLDEMKPALSRYVLPRVPIYEHHAQAGELQPKDKEGL